MESESSTASRERGITFWVILFLVVVFVAYPLSVGPIAAIYFNKSPQWIERLYAPVQYAYDQIPAVRHFYDWYMPLWIKNP